MELTEQNFRDRLEFIVECHSKVGEDWEELGGRLKEKGVEYCIVLPLFEVVLGFDPLEDIKMEHGSVKYNNQRFDFIVQPQKHDHCSLVVEAKALNESNLKKHEEQIVKYMKDNQEYPWGILTNGFKWHFYLSKKYIETKFNDGYPLADFKNKNIFKIISLSLKDEHFIEIMNSMAKGKLGDFWLNLARYTYATISGGPGKKPAVNSNIKINEFLTGKIKEAVEIKRGEYWQAIQAGKVKAGDKVICKNDFLELTFELDHGGRLVLKPGMANSKDFNQFTKRCPNGVDLLIEWLGSTNTFTDSSQVILLLTGGKNFTQRLQKEFPFAPLL
jgi:hypothetical protein